MLAFWNDEKSCYDINLTEKELGTLLFALTVAKFETKDAAVAELQKEFVNLNSRDIGYE